MNNEDVSAVLREMAELLELKGESGFRIRAYDNASKALGALTEDVSTLAAGDRLEDVKGIGKGISKNIHELLETGHIAQLEGLRQEFPSGVRALLNVPGIGPSTARRVFIELGVQNLDELRAAAEDGRLATLPGLGEKSVENIVRALSRVNKRDNRISIGKALPLVEKLVAELRAVTAGAPLVAGGSLRRWSPTVGDIDLMTTAPDASSIMQTFVDLPHVRDVLGHGATKSSIVSDNGVQVDLRVVELESFGSLLQHFTGSRAHNIELREYALKRGQSLNEYGIVNVASGNLTKYGDETQFYAALDLDFIPPELREGSGEIAAARSRSLPKLVTQREIKGDLHVHSEWSDGSLPVEDMVRAAADRGYEYVAITDHSGGIGVAHGLHPDRLKEQIRLVREIDERYPNIRVFTGTEVDIRRDGTLDFSDDVLADLDWVVASVHSGFNQTEEEMTARIISAIENPHVDAIGHPTGRLINKRAPYAVDLEAVFTAAARSGTALEINSFPERLDLVDTHARRAKDLGVKLVINTDAHAPVHFDNIRYGVAMARRAWAEAGDVLNTMPVHDIEAWLRRASPSP